MSESSISPRTFVLTYVALVVFTFMTVCLSFLRLGEVHIVVGLFIGTIKAALVVLFFMHLVRSPSRNWLALGVGLFWLSIMLALTMTDYLPRHLASY
jgi:cytochrome c oxidase subunit 4